MCKSKWNGWMLKGNFNVWKFYLCCIKWMVVSSKCTSAKKMHRKFPFKENNVEENCRDFWSAGNAMQIKTKY